ncbi:hypothetical protein G7K_1489-t1 [Saitoella complicata NRRL Y-17804]|uniref:LysM domain-containing protein n=2 Tax=Saitoella complicata (strain BCRC 22490 / CBS 7301 / JCM 7358 / NBRC 10748 / NRRL Y-17804) TaxID=698492 RepID=A0A0E9NBR3_SAICN|nr:hypothetical protein G7K_1489-t1 [Saitoella complicata NRRL Y-17804]
MTIDTSQSQIRPRSSRSLSSPLFPVTVHPLKQSSSPEVQNVEWDMGSAGTRTEGYSVWSRRRRRGRLDSVEWRRDPRDEFAGGRSVSADELKRHSMARAGANETGTGTAEAAWSTSTSSVSTASTPSSHYATYTWQKYSDTPQPSPPERTIKVYMHPLRHTDTLPFISLAYGILPASIRRANRLWATDSLHARGARYLTLPIDECSIGAQPARLVDTDDPNLEGERKLVWIRNVGEVEIKDIDAGGLRYFPSARRKVEVVREAEGDEEESRQSTESIVVAGAQRVENAVGWMVGKIRKLNRGAVVGDLIEL